jgi:hypothetical protein
VTGNPEPFVGYRGDMLFECNPPVARPFRRHVPKPGDVSEQPTWIIFLVLCEVPHTVPIKKVVFPLIEALVSESQDNGRQIYFTLDHRAPGSFTMSISFGTENAALNGRWRHTTELF